MAVSQKIKIMTKDEKIIEAVNFIKEQQKILSDFASKGMLLHMAITAFSITLFFQTKKVPRDIIQISNIAVTLFAAFFSVVIFKDGKRSYRQITELFGEADIKMNKFQLKSWYWISLSYVSSCILLIGFWISLWFFNFSKGT